MLLMFNRHGPECNAGLTIPRPHSRTSVYIFSKGNRSSLNVSISSGPFSAGRNAIFILFLQKSVTLHGEVSLAS